MTKIHTGYTIVLSKCTLTNKLFIHSATTQLCSQRSHQKAAQCTGCSSAIKTIGFVFNYEIIFLPWKNKPANMTVLFQSTLVVCLFALVSVCLTVTRDVGMSVCMFIQCSF